VLFGVFADQGAQVTGGKTDSGARKFAHNKLDSGEESVRRHWPFTDRRRSAGYSNSRFGVRGRDVHKVSKVKGNVEGELRHR
jgi:hypothetical protein